MRTRRARVMVVVWAAAAGVALFGSACGSRGPLDDGPIYLAADAAAADVAVDVAEEPAVDAAPPPVEAGTDGGIVECGTCVIDQCGTTLLSCFQSQPCQQALQCVVQTCLQGGGGLDASCLLQCGSGNTAGALQVFQIFQCVTSTCGPDCNSVLGGLLGGLGGLGGGG